MTTLLDELLASIEPSRTRDRLRSRMDDAINCFRVDCNTFDDAITYRATLCRFVKLLDAQLGVMPAGASIPDNVLWRRASTLLRKAYGPHGEVAAFETQRSGAEAGFYGVMRRLASTAVDDRIEEEVSQRIRCFCERLSADEYLATGAEYVQKHGHLLPAEMREGFAARVRLNLESALKQHHRLLVATNRVGR